MKAIDLTHVISPAIPVFPGDPQVELKQIAALDQDGYCTHQAVFPLHVGTHIDAPRHILPGGRALSEFEADKFIGRGVLLDARNCSSVDIELLNGVDFDENSIVLVATGRSRSFGSPGYFQALPVSEEFAKALASAPVKAVGFDMASVDERPFPIHQILLSREVLLIENLTNLETLFVAEPFTVYALPLKIAADGAPARVIAVVD